MKAIRREFKEIGAETGTADRDSFMSLAVDVACRIGVKTTAHTSYLNLFDLGGIDALENELCDAVPSLDCMRKTIVNIHFKSTAVNPTSALHRRVHLHPSYRAIQHVTWRTVHHKLSLSKSTDLTPLKVTPVCPHFPVLKYTLVIGVRMIEQNNTHVTAVVRVNNSGPHVHVVLPGQARAGGCTMIEYCSDNMWRMLLPKNSNAMWLWACAVWLWSRCAFLYKSKHWVTMT